MRYAGSAPSPITSLRSGTANDDPYTNTVEALVVASGGTVPAATTWCNDYLESHRHPRDGKPTRS
jgi:hypothetical protein